MNKKNVLDAFEAKVKAGKAAAELMESLWVLDDGRTGNLNRCLGVAAALGFDDPEVIAVRAKWATRWLDWLLVPWVFEGLPKVEDYPQVVVAAGARCSRVAAWMKRQKPGLFVVQIMRPAKAYGAYDVVVMEQHDSPPKRANVCVTVGAVNHVTKAKLEKEGQRWEARLKACGKPRLAVMVGGGSKHGVFGRAEAARLAEELLAVARENGAGLMVSTSRRTGAEATAVLEKALTSQTKVAVHVWKPDNPQARDNPYLGYLALADAVVVTGDSISMVSEAATAGKPVYVWVGDGVLPRKFKAFLEAMQEQGRVRVWGGKLNLRPPAAPLMDTAVVAGFVKSRWRMRR
ncbi:MAG: mitochondrial fission ELM1 family protein [Alphaproteobacteria bacterium]